MHGSGSLDTLAPIFFTSHYWIMLAVNIVICIGINIGLDIWVMSGQSAPYYVVSGATAGNVIAFSLVVSFFNFWSSGGQHKRIKEGAALPVTRRALCDTCFKKVVLFSMQEPNWKKRILLFMWNSFLFPGCFVALVVVFICYLACGFTANGNSCEVSPAVNIVVIECWKTVLCIVIFSSMYAASHNEEQPEIADAIRPAALAATALGSTDDMYGANQNAMA